MIIEDYVSFETAKLLKEKGFDGKCYKVWVHYTSSTPMLWAAPAIVDRESVESAERTWNTIYCDSENKNHGYLAPTPQMAMKWLREEHNILLVADYEYECTDTSYYYKVYRLGENGKPERCAVKGEHYDRETNKIVEDIVGYRDYERSYSDYRTYEEACDDGIKYCLENLAK